MTGLPNTSDKPAPLETLTALLFSVLGMLITLALDSLYGGATSAPVIGICTLFLLALKYPPRIVGLCLLPLAAFVAFLLWYAPSDLCDSSIDLARFWIRALTFFAAGLLAIATSNYRVRLDGARVHFLRVLESVPIPLLVSDAAGSILSVSGAAVDASGMAKENLIGFRMPDVLGAHLLEETEENWYQHWISSPENKIFEVELQMGKLRSKARIGRVGSGRHAIMIVIFL